MLLWNEGLSPNFLRLFASAYRHFKTTSSLATSISSFNYIREKINHENNCDHHFLDAILRFFLLAKKTNYCDSGKTFGEFSGERLESDVVKFNGKRERNLSINWSNYSISAWNEWISVSHSELQSPKQRKQCTNQKGNGWKSWEKFSRSRSEFLLCYFSLPVNLSIKTWARQEWIDWDEWEL